MDDIVFCELLAALDDLASAIADLLPAEKSAAWTTHPLLHDSLIVKVHE